MASENNHWYVGTNPDTMGAKSQTGKGSENKDPLPYDVKIKAMEALWPDVANHIVPEESIMTLASKVYREHGEGVNLVAYTDEAWILKLLTEYNNKEAKHGYYNFANITTKPTPRLSSATDVRNAVKADDREAFERAAGVPADYKIDGKNYFDLVAGYLLSQPKENKSDKYLQQKNIEESKMDIARLRKLSGMPAVLNEGAPVDFGDKIKPAHGMTDNERKLADIGRLLMDRAKTESDDAVSNAMAQLGDRLATGSITDQSELVDFVKSSTADPATLSDSVTKTFAAYGAGERADMSKVDDRRKGSARPGEEEPGEEPEDMGTDSYADAEDDDYEYDGMPGSKKPLDRLKHPLDDSIDLSDIRAEYEGNEFTGELNKAKEEGDDEFEVDGKKYKVEEEEMDEGVGQFSVKKRKSTVVPGSDKEMIPDVEETEFDIIHNGKVVGDLRTDDYLAYIHGSLYGKDLPELSHYGTHRSSGISNTLQAFLKSKTGQRWATTGKLRGKNILELEEAEMDEGVKCDCCNATPCTCGPECPTCGGMDESIEETADNAVAAAMAELRKLAGL